MGCVASSAVEGEGRPKSAGRPRSSKRVPATRSMSLVAKSKTGQSVGGGSRVQGGSLRHPVDGASNFNAVSVASSDSDDVTDYRSTLGPDSAGSGYSGASANRGTISESVDTLKEFTAEEMARATEGFSHELGEGGFGVVYRGQVDLGAEGVVPVAVKVLREDSTQGFKEWQAELKFLGDLEHPNLVRLHGYCYDGDDWSLVYEFVPNGSFDFHLFSCPKKGEGEGEGGGVVPFAARLKVLLGAAKGMEYLHGGCGRKVIHRDLKTANILVDKDFNAKVSDFGLAREGPEKGKTHVSTGVVGTSGYLAPEYMERGHVSERSDVYSFGVIMLEVISGRPVSATVDGVPMLDWASKILKGKPENFTQLVDPALGDRLPEKSLKLMLLAARAAVHDDPHKRPPMSKIVEVLTVSTAHAQRKEQHALELEQQKQKRQEEEREKEERKLEEKHQHQQQQEQQGAQKLTKTMSRLKTMGRLTSVARRGSNLKKSSSEAPSAAAPL